MKKVISLILAISVFASVGIVSAKTTYTDINGHWAEEQIGIWSDYGVISGYNGEFAPNRSITRGEFAVVLNRLMAYDKTVENRFADLGEKYYTDSILKLNKAGVMQGFDGKISPENSLTREEAAIMICRALGIETEDTADKTFEDYSFVSEWARPYINAMVNKGLLNGSDGKLNPKNSISRAEVITILNNAVFPVVSDEQDVVKSFDISKILVISVGNTTIENCEINGKIIITQGVKKGTVTFKDSEIKGEIVIDNDREEFIKLEDTTVADEDMLENEAFVSEKKEDKEDKDDGGGSGGSGGNSGSGNGKDDDKDENDKPSQPENPSEPEKPNDPENPSEPEKPNDPETPSEPEKPSEPEIPSEPEKPKDPDEPDVPDSPSEPDEPEVPDVPDEPEEPIDYSEINAEMVENLQLISDDISLYIDSKYPNFYSVFTNEEKYILKNIKKCIDKAITYEDSEVIDADFIKSTFNDEILDVKSVYDDLRDRDKHGEFHKKLATNLTTYTLLWLAETLGIDLSEYGIDVSEIQ